VFDFNTLLWEVWVGKEGVAPLKTWDLQCTVLGDIANWTCQAITSQTGLTGPADLEFFCRNIAVVDNIATFADAHALIAEGSQA